MILKKITIYFTLHCLIFTQTNLKKQQKYIIKVNYRNKNNVIAFD